MYCDNQPTKKMNRTEPKATLKLFTRDVSASNVYRKIVPNCWPRDTKTAAAKTRPHARDDEVVTVVG